MDKTAFAVAVLSVSISSVSLAQVYQFNGAGAPENLDAFEPALTTTVYPLVACADSSHVVRQTTENTLASYIILLSPITVNVIGLEDGSFQISDSSPLLDNYYTFDCVYEIHYVYRFTWSDPSYEVIANYIQNHSVHAEMVAVAEGHVAERTRNLGPCEAFCAAGDSLNPATGNVYREEVDYADDTHYFGVSFSRFYNSQSLHSGRLGNKWLSNYEQSVKHFPLADLAVVTRSDGKELPFFLDEATSDWRSHDDVTGILEATENGGVITGWLYRNERDISEAYDVNGKLTSLTTLEGFVITLSYTEDADPETLDMVTGPSGKVLEFAYDTEGRIATLIDPAGATYTYTYDAANNLVKVIFPDEAPFHNPHRLYHYEDPQFPHALTGMTDENSERYRSWSYDHNGRGATSKLASDVAELTLSYTEDQDGQLISTSIQPVIGANQTLSFTIREGVRKLTDIMGDRCVLCGGNTKSTTYDSNGFVSTRTDFGGNLTLYQHNSRGLEECRIKGHGTAQSRRTETEWHADFRVPTKETVYGLPPGHQGGEGCDVDVTGSSWIVAQETDYQYDGSGRLASQTTLAGSP